MDQGLQQKESSTKKPPTFGSFLLARFRGHEFPGRDLPEGAHLEGLRRAC